mmetsp:Transcript_37285/g.80266  ORF Transcript_37285/g.80266 Transcript_37285/m.80266 type:complete len:277 (-) Transcript_37285:53-883(-)
MHRRRQHRGKHTRACSATSLCLCQAVLQQAQQQRKARAAGKVAPELLRCQRASHDACKRSQPLRQAARLEAAQQARHTNEARPHKAHATVHQQPRGDRLDAGADQLCGSTHGPQQQAGGQARKAAGNRVSDRPSQLPGRQVGAVLVRSVYMHQRGSCCNGGTHRQAARASQLCQAEYAAQHSLWQRALATRITARIGASDADGLPHDGAVWLVRHTAGSLLIQHRLHMGSACSHLDGTCNRCMRLHCGAADGGAGPASPAAYASCPAPHASLLARR